MDMILNDTNPRQPQDTKPQNVSPVKVLSNAQEQFVSFKAVDGTIVNTGESVQKMTLTEFADYLGVTRVTLYRWQESIPNFWDRVKQRREAIGGRDMTSKVWNRVYVDALSGKVEQQKLWLGQFDGWKPPAQQNDVQITGLADLVNLARKRKLENERQQTQVIDLQGDLTS